MEESHDPEAESGDHRVRVARERRERMRHRLLQSVLASYAAMPLGGPPPVETVIAQADVSKATFYKYFASIDEAVQALGHEMAEDMVEALKILYSPAHSPEFRMTTSMLIFITRSIREPLWATFVSRADVLGVGSEVRRGIQMHIGRARERGFLRFDSPEAAISLAMGSLEEAMRHAALTHAEFGFTEEVPTFVREVLLLILQGLGADHDEARLLVDETATFARTAAPERLPSWRDALVAAEATE